MVELSVDNVAKISLKTEEGRNYYWEFSNSIEGAKAVLQYISQSGPKDDGPNQIAEEWIRSNFEELNNEGYVNAVCEKIRSQPNFVTAYGLMAEIAIQSAYQMEFGPFQEYIGENISADGRNGFLKEFCQKFVAPIPSNVQEHIQAKQQIISNYGQSIFDILHGDGFGENKVVCEALLAFSSWYPVDWYPEVQDELLALLNSNQSSIVPFPFLIYASVIQRNHDLFDVEMFQQLVLFQLPEAEDADYLNRRSAVLLAQSELFRAGGDILVESNAIEFGELLCDIVEQYFFDLGVTVSTKNAEPVTVNIMSTLIYLFKKAPQFAERLAKIAIFRWRGLFHPGRIEPILCRSDAIKEVEMLFMSAYTNGTLSTTISQIIVEEYLAELDEEGSMACALAQASISKIIRCADHNWNSEFVGPVFEAISGLLESDVSELGPMSNQYFGQLYLAAKLASLSNEFCTYGFNIALQSILIEHYSKTGTIPEQESDLTTEDTVQKAEFQDLLVDICTGSSTFDLNQEYVSAVLTSGSKGNVKAAAAMFGQVADEYKNEVILGIISTLNDILSQSGSDANLRANIIKYFPFFSNIGLTDEEAISPAFDFIMQYAETTISSEALNAAYINAFKCCAAKALLEHFQEIAERSSKGLLSIKAFSDLILSALKSGRSAKDHASDGYQSQSMIYGIQFISNEFLGQIIGDIYNFIVTTFQNTRHIPTTGETYRRRLGPLMRTMFEILENASGTLREAGIEEPVPPYQFVHDAIAERCFSPEAFQSVRSCYKMFAANRAETSPENLAYCSGIYWNFFYAPDFNPNRQNWGLVVQLMVSDMCNDAFTLKGLRDVEKDQNHNNICLLEYYNKIQENASFIIERTGEFINEYMEKLQDYVNNNTVVPRTHVSRTVAQLGNIRKAYGFDQ